MALYRRLLEIDPNLALAYNNLGILLNGKGQVVEAEACYRNAIDRDANNAHAYLNLGILLKGKGDTEGMKVHYRRVLELEPNHPQKADLLAAINK